MIHDRPANDVIPDECYENTSADINEYRALVAESTTAAAELRLLVQSVRELLAGFFRSENSVRTPASKYSF